MSYIGLTAELSSKKHWGSVKQRCGVKALTSSPPKQTEKRFAPPMIPAFPGAEPHRDVKHLVVLASSAIKSDPGFAKALLEEAAALIGTFDDELTARTRNGSTGRQLAPWQMRRIDEYIELNIGSTIRNCDLARVARLSVSYFSRTFRLTIGQPPHAYVVNQRLKRARTLMTQSRDPLAQIALACGFADQAHLSRIFKQRIGKSPVSWRRAREVVPDEISLTGASA